MFLWDRTQDFVNKKIITPKIQREYVSIVLHKHGVSKTYFVHGLLAKTFISNPDNKPEINHKNGIKTDNRIANLEWCTHQENMQHAFRTGLINPENRCKPIVDICTGKVYKSGIKDVAMKYSITPSACKSYLNGNRKNPTCLRYYKPANTSYS